MKITVDLTPAMLNVIGQALDAYVRQNGLNVARDTVLVQQHLQQAAEAAENAAKVDAAGESKPSAPGPENMNKTPGR